MIYTKTELYALRRIWEGIMGDSEFPSFEAFADWAQGKYRAGFTVYKLRENSPHSPENSYWYYADKKLEEVTSPICEGCTETMRVCNGIGCLKYREQFVENWNKNICRKPKEPEEKKETRAFFRYEHPDLVREGIVFEPNKHI